MTRIESLPLFPLSDVVLLPQVSIPLYIFEPRYRQMTRDALEGNHQIGMVTVRPEGLQAMAGDPRLFDIGCLGRIAQAQERPDGTFQIMLLGESRFRVLEEAPRTGDRLYRSARVELLPDREPTGDVELEAMARARSELLALLERLVQGLDATRDPAGAVAAFERLEPVRLVNALTRSIAFTPVERQQLLEADSIVGRFETMADLLRFRLAEMGAGRADGESLPN
jgi:Lon protease-like protein